MTLRRTLLFAAALPLLPHPSLAQAPDAPWFPAWEGVLQRHVDDQGRVNFAGIAADPGPLAAITEAIGAGGPLGDPAALAWHINAYNALAMRGIVLRGIPESLGVLGRYSFFANTAIRVAGRTTTLKSFEDDVIRAMGEERVHFALNCMVRGCPRLPRTAFRTATLEASLAAAAREFCSSSYHVRPDPGARTVRVSQIFDFFTADFVPAKAPSIIAYINRWRAQPIPADWTLRFFDYDWSINRQPAPARAGG
ncbi:MAG: DUF547 domain-containing protein [Pseudomonadota bacterium]